MASGQITMRKVDGWQSLGEQIAVPIDVTPKPSNHHRAGDEPIRPLSHNARRHPRRFVRRQCHYGASKEWMCFMTGTATWNADPLTWGHGPCVFEMFLEPTCPFSVRALGKLDEILALAGEDRVTIKIRLQSQPWHMYSGVIVRCILAASTLRAGREAARAVMAAVAAHREEFEFTNHCGGPNMDATPKDIIARIEGYSGLHLTEAFGIPNLDRLVKWHCKYARQNGIHTSPTFMVDGLVQSDISSGDAVSDWVSRLLAT